MKEDFFIKEVKKLGIDIKEKEIKIIKEYYDFLYKYNKTTNLTTIVDYEETLLKHFYDSLTSVRTVDFLKVDSVIDIGTGAGFPGVVLKIFYPHIKLTLLDSNNKKIEFLKQLIKKLNFKEVKIIHGRVEELNNRENYDLVIARAVKSLDILLEICLPLVKIEGIFIALKGKIADELSENLNVIKELGCKLITVDAFELPIEKSTRTIIKIVKNKKTPLKYPRSYSQIMKKPLKNSVK